MIRQKGESKNGCFKKAKHAQISEKQIYETPVLRFALLPYHQRITKVNDCPNVFRKTKLLFPEVNVN